MPTCRFCDHRNPAGQLNCASCGAELPRDPNAPPAQRAERTMAHRDDLRDEIRNMLQREGKIAAIKHYRETTGVGLREAKEAVETLAVEAGATPAQSSGCTAVIVAILATGCLVGTCVIAGFGRWPW